MNKNSTPLFFLFLLSFIIFFISVSPLAFAQTEDNQDQDSAVPTEKVNTIQKKGDGFTGTLSDEDPDSDAFKEKKVFGDDEAGDDSANDSSEEEIQNPNATHILKLEFESQVVISDTKADNAYLEINYTTKIEQEIEVKNKRFRTKGKADIITDVVGNLAGNELFSCKLDIQFDKTPIDIMTRYNNTEETDEEPTKSELAVQLKFNKSDFMEDWFSNCMGVDGSVLNTKGDKEKYLVMTLESITPSLDALLFEDYFPDETSSLDITTDPIVIDDTDSLQQYALQGSGTVTIEPLASPQ